MAKNESVRTVTFARPELETVCQQCIKNVKGLLSCICPLLTEKITRIYALGLYLYAVEEYGKVCLLRSYLVEDKKAYSIPMWIFGMGKRKSHDMKIDKGFQHLPSECQKISSILEIKINTSSKTQVFTLENGSKVVVSPFTTGLFEDTTHTQSFIELNYKTRCFYIDSSITKNQDRDNIEVDRTRMKINVGLIDKALKKF